MDKTTPLQYLDKPGAQELSALQPAPRPASARPHWAVLVALTVLYALAGKLGLMVAIVHPSASAVWAPTGIAIAALLRLGTGVWPAIAIGAFLVNVTTAGSIVSSIGIAAGNTLETLAAVWLVNRFANGRHAFDRAGDILRFTFFAGVVATTISPTLGVVSLAVQGFAQWSDFGSIWLTWWLGDVGGALVVAPLLLLWIENPRLHWNQARALEAVVLFVTLIAVGQLVFGMPTTAGLKGHPLAFLCMPVLGWAAFRFDQRTASTALFVLSIVAVTGTLRATAPLERWELNQALLMLQVFMAVAAVTMLTFASLVAEGVRADQEVRAASEELRGAMNELETFNHSISHDLRTPVGAVLNYSALIEEDYGTQLDEKGVRMVRGIRASAESAAGLLDQLVQLGWAGRERRERLLVDMTALARDVQAELVAAGAEAEQVHFEVRELPPVWGSAALLRCVMRNLFSNSIKYTRGRPERRVRVEGAAGARENAYWITDNGIGFDPALAEAVFQPFRRFAHGDRYEGSGLGLAIAARIVRRHGGRIWGESDGVNGARFCFTIPSNGAAG